MKVRIQDFTGSVFNDLEQKLSIFVRRSADRMVELSTPKTPKKTGRLRMDVIKSVVGKKGTVVWGKRYAVKMEKVQFQNYTTPGTGPHFAEHAAEQLVKETGLNAREVGLTK